MWLYNYQNTTKGKKQCERVILSVFKSIKLTFALIYLNLFNKEANLANEVGLSMQDGDPLMVEYEIGNLGVLRFYLASMINEEN